LVDYLELPKVGEWDVRTENQSVEMLEKMRVELKVCLKVDKMDN
jgi:hypothetical protein